MKTLFNLRSLITPYLVLLFTGATYAQDQTFVYALTFAQTSGTIYDPSGVNIFANVDHTYHPNGFTADVYLVGQGGGSNFLATQFFPVGDSQVQFFNLTSMNYSDTCYYPTTNWTITAFFPGQASLQQYSPSFTITPVTPVNMAFSTLPNAGTNKLIISSSPTALSDDTNLNALETIYFTTFPYNAGCALAQYYIQNTYFDNALDSKLNFSIGAAGLEYGYGYIVTNFETNFAVGLHTVTCSFSGNTPASTNTVTKMFYINSLIDLAPTTPSGWSAPVVVSRTAGSTTDATNLTAGDSLFVGFAVANIGRTASGPFGAEVLLDSSIFGTYQQTNILQPSGSPWTVTSIPLGMLAHGSHQIELVIDPMDAIAETNKANNTFTKTITVSLVSAQSVSLNFIGSSQSPILQLSPVAPGIIYEVQGSSNLNTWAALTNIQAASNVVESSVSVPLPVANGTHFYRAMMVYK